jgi:MFS family permease
MIKADTKFKSILYIMVFTYFTYGLFGAVTGSLSVSIMDYYQIDTAQRGLMVTFQGLGGILVFLIMLVFGERLKKLLAYLIGMALMSVFGLLIAAKPGLYLFMAFLVFWGIGTLMVDSLCNSIVSDHYQSRQNKYIPVVHLAYAAGFVLSNVMVNVMTGGVSKDNWYIVYLVYGLAALLGTILLAVTALKTKKDASFKADPQPMGIHYLPEVIKKPKTWRLLISMVIFAAFFCMITTWLPYQWEKELGFGREISILSASILYLGAIFMRLLSPKLLHRISPQWMLFAGNISGAVCILVSVIIKSHVLTLIFTVLGGFLTGGNSSYFAIIALRLYPDKTSFATIILMFSSVFTMFCTPWISGAMAKATSMTNAFVIICLCLAVASPLVLDFKKTRPADVQSILNGDQESRRSKKAAAGQERDGFPNQ